MKNVNGEWADGHWPCVSVCVMAVNKPLYISRGGSSSSHNAVPYLRIDYCDERPFGSALLKL